MRSRLRTAEAWTALALSWLLVFVLPFRVLSALLGAGGVGEPAGVVDGEAAHLAAARAIARRIERLALSFPGRATCLVRAVAGWLLLKRRGIPSVLRFGVRRRNGALEAHAWLRVGEAIVLGGDEAESFVPIADFGKWTAAGGPWRR